jgi:hypothetical protein
MHDQLQSVVAIPDCLDLEILVEIEVLADHCHDLGVATD